MTKVLMISTDAKILEEGSPVRARMIEYGTLFAELHIVVFSKSGARQDISANVHVYPTKSSSKFSYVSDAVRIGSGVILDAGFSGMDSVITTQDPFETGVVGRKLAARFSLPLHVQIHTDFNSPYFKHGVLNRIRVALASKSLARAKAIRVVSERVRMSLAPDMRSKTSVLPIFSELESIRRAFISSEADLRKKYPQFDKIILMASRITREKDIPTALSAFALLRKGFPRAGLVIVGAGNGADAQALGAKGEGIAVEPWADHDTLVSYMKTCDVFLSSSLYEGYGLSMLEAYMAGATLVATDAGIAPLLADEKALVAPKSPRNMAVGLKMALEGTICNKEYKSPYLDKKAYLEAYKADIEKALL